MHAWIFSCDLFVFVLKDPKTAKRTRCDTLIPALIYRGQEQIKKSQDFYCSKNELFAPPLFPFGCGSQTNLIAVSLSYAINNKWEEGKHHRKRIFSENLSS